MPGLGHTREREGSIKTLGVACLAYGLETHLPMQVYERVAAHARAGHYMGGSCFWCLTAADYPDYDGFKISFGQRSAQAPAAASLQQKDPASSAADLPPSGAKPEKSGSERGMQQGEPPVLQQSSSGASMKAGGVSSQGTAAAASSHLIQETQQMSCGTEPRYQQLSSSSMLRRVSSRTEGNVEAAAAIFDGEGAQSELQAAHLGAETMYLITEHAAAMHALNQQAAGKDCRVM